MNDDSADTDKLVDQAAEMRRQGDLRGAIKVYTRLLRRHAVSELYNERGVLYSQLGDRDHAIKDLTCAIDLSNEDSDCYVNRGNEYFWIGDFEAALDDYNRAIEFAPGFAEAYNGRGNVYAHLNREDEAAKDFLDSIKLDKTRASPYHNLAQLLLNMGEIEEAVPYAVKANELLPNDAASLCLLGDIFVAQCEFTHALQKYIDATNADPKFVIADLRVASLLSTCPDESVRNGEQAIEYAMRACRKTDWKDYYGLAALAVAYAECGQYDDAAHWQAGAVAMAPPAAVDAAKAFLADIHGRQRRQSATQHLEEE